MSLINCDFCLFLQRHSQSLLLLCVTKDLRLELVIFGAKSLVHDFQILNLAVQLSQHLSITVKFELLLSNDSIELIGLLSVLSRAHGFSVGQKSPNCLQLSCHTFLTSDKDAI